MTEERMQMKRYVILFLVELVLLVLAAGIFSGIFRQKMEDFHKEQVRNAMEQVQTQGKKIAEAQKLETEAFDKVYKSKARFASYAIQNDNTFAREVPWVQAMRDRLHCTNLYIVGRRGKSITLSEDRDIDFYRPRYNQLRDTFNEGRVTEPFSITQEDGKTYRYYAMKINDDCEAVVEQDDSVLQDILKKTGDWKNWLKPAAITYNSYVYVVSALDGSILYDSRGSKETATIESYGSDLSSLKDGSLTDKGQTDEAYVGTVFLEDQEAFVRIVCPKKDLAAVSDRLTGGIIILLGVFLAMVILCSSKKKAIHMALSGAVIMIAAGFLFTSLLVITENNYKEQVVSRQENQAKKIQEDVLEEFIELENEEALIHANAAAEIIGRHDFMRTRDHLKRISDALGFDYMMIYDKDMKETLTSGDYVNMNLSDDKDDPFYELSDLRYGVEERIWGPAEDPITGEYHGYAGVRLKINGNPAGFILASFDPAKLGDKLQAGKDSDIEETEVTKSQDGRAEAFEYAVLTGEVSLLALLIILILAIYLGTYKHAALAAPATIGKIAGFCVSALVFFWVVLPEKALPSWSVLRQIIEANFWRQGGAAYKPGISAFTAGLLATGVVVFLTTILGGLRMWISNASDEQKKPMIEGGFRLVQGLLWLVLAGVWLVFFGVPVQVLLIVAVILLLVIGFGGNTVFGDLAAGIWILIAGIIHVGDRVETQDGTGMVDQIHLTHTILRQEDGSSLLISNRALAGGKIRIF